MKGIDVGALSPTTPRKSILPENPPRLDIASLNHSYKFVGVVQECLAALCLAALLPARGLGGSGQPRGDCPYLNFTTDVDALYYG